MNAGKVASPAPAPPPHQKNNADLNVCEEVRRRAVLTPPGIIDALCEGRQVYWVCSKAVFAEEALELARMLGRAYLLNFDAGC
jgi:hypothetical protein